MSKKRKYNSIKNTEKDEDSSLKISKSNNKKVPFYDFKTDTKQKVFSIILIVIMFFSSIAFIMLFSNDTTSNYEGGDVPFQMFEQNGLTYFGTRKNSEEFIFEEIDSFLNQTTLEDISNLILNESNINILIGENYTKNENIFLLEKSLNANRINSQKYFNEDDIQNSYLTIVLQNSSNIENSVNLNSFNYSNIEGLVYYLVR